jgi:hypothetical protein
LGLWRFNQAHHPTALGAAVSLVWRVRIGLWLGRWSGFRLVWALSGDLTFKELPDLVEQVTMHGAEEAVISDPLS